MSYSEELDAKKAARRQAIEKEKRQLKLVGRYFLFYCAYIFVLSIVSYLLDQVFYYIDYGPSSRERYPILQYVPYYILVGYMILPLTILYNYLVNEMITGKLNRIAAGILFSLIVGLFISINYRFGYYIGEYRQIKNVIAMALTGIVIEFLRIWIVAIRNKNRK